MGNRGNFDPTNIIVDSVSSKWRFKCQPIALTQKDANIIIICLLSNIDRITMVTDFGELNKKYAISRLLYKISPKSLHKLKSFQRHWRYLNFTATNLHCHGNKI